MAHRRFWGVFQAASDGVGATIATTVGAGPRGIGGWLTIPAIGLVLAPIISTISFVLGFDVIRSVTPELLSDARLWATIAIDVTGIIATITVAILFFQKRRIAVPAIVILMVIMIVASAVQLFLSNAIFGETSPRDAKPIVHSLVFAAVWIPYFGRSRRVENTFVN